MNGVFRLTRLYGTAGSWQRWFLLAGALIVGACMYYPPANGRWAYLPLVAFTGVMVLFIGGSLMPMVVFRLATSRGMCVLPFGRAKLIGSALLTTALIALPLPLIVGLIWKETLPEYRQLTLLNFVTSPSFVHIYAAVFWTCSALYFVMWLFTGLKTIKRTVFALAVVVALVAIPPRLFALGIDTVKLAPLLFALGSWLVFSIYVVYLPRWRDIGNTIAALRLESILVGSLFDYSAKKMRGQEAGIVLGLHSQWVQALAFFIVIVLATVATKHIPGHLYYVSLFSVIAGALSGVATVKSRALWLRRPWSREELFCNIERFVWRQMRLALALLVLWFIATSVYFDLPLVRMAIGALLVSLMFTLCLYLGLLQTRGMRWGDAMFALVIVLASLGLAIYASKPAARTFLVLTFEAALIAAILAIKHWVKRRWQRIDWLMCRA
jgi:hypothetical protein